MKKQDEERLKRSLDLNRHMNVNAAYRETLRAKRIKEKQQVSEDFENKQEI